MRHLRYIHIYSILCAVLFLTPFISHASTAIKRSTNNLLGLVGWWTFDGNTMTSNVGDSSGRGNNGFLSGFTSTTTTIGKIGQGLQFDGTDDKVTMSLDLSGGQQSSYAFWYYTDTWALGTDILMSHGQFPNVGYSYFTPNNSGGGCASGLMELGHDGGTGFNYACYTQPSVGWHHFVFIHDNTQTANEVDLYIDGVIQTPTSRPGTPNNTANLLNGTLTFMAHPSGLNVSGILDDLRIYNRVLSSSEALALYNSGSGKIGGDLSKVVSDGLFGYWTFDGRNMTQKIEDISGNGNHAFILGQTATTTSVGKVGQAWQADGVNDCAAVPSMDLNGVSKVAMSFWYKKESAFETDDGINFEYTDNVNTGGNYGFGFDPNSTFPTSGKQAVFIKGGNGTNANLAEWDRPTSGVWHHYVWNIDLAQSNENQQVYIDGVSQTLSHWAGNLDSGSAFTGPKPFYIMSRGCASLWNDGVMDELRLYKNKNLSQTEVMTLYNLGQQKINKTNTPTGLQSGLVGHWTFDGNKMTSNVADSSGRGNNATLDSGFTSTTTTIGKVGQAITCDGVNDEINVPHTSAFDITGDITFAAWVKPRVAFTGATYGTVLAKANGSVFDYEFYISTFATGNNKLTVYGDNPGPNNIFGNTAIPTGVWSHVAVSRIGSNFNFYLNGVADGTSVDADSFTVNTIPVRVCTDDYDLPNSLFPGDVDDLRLYNRGLSSSEIQALYNLGK